MFVRTNSNHHITEFHLVYSSSLRVHVEVRITFVVPVYATLGGGSTNVCLLPILVVSSDWSDRMMMDATTLTGPSVQHAVISLKVPCEDRDVEIIETIRFDSRPTIHRSSLLCSYHLYSLAEPNHAMVRSVDHVLVLGQTIVTTKT